MLNTEFRRHHIEQEDLERVRLWERLWYGGSEIKRVVDLHNSYDDRRKELEGLGDFEEAAHVFVRERQSNESVPPSLSVVHNP